MANHSRGTQKRPMTVAMPGPLRPGPEFIRSLNDQLVRIDQALRSINSAVLALDERITALEP